MNFIHRLLTALGAVGLVASSHPVEAQDTRTPAQLQEEAELHCQRALQENTIEALEEYLRLFPRAPTACRVLALEALSQFDPDTLQPGEALSSDSNQYGG